MPGLRFHHVSKAFEDGTVAVDDLELTLEDGEFLVLVGPSGCGKTTSLRMAAGLEDPTSGEIYLGDQLVNDVPTRRRNIAMVFQSYALYPHMSVEQNLAFGLRMRGVGKSARRRQARHTAEILGIDDLLLRRPRQLSGGQRQRVAMGRAIVREPQAFLMDEPLSNLDAKLRVQMRAEIARIQCHLGTTTLYVTHDQVEAMTMGDRVAVMRRGVVQQAAAPKELYDHPVNLFVAGFIGSPPMNLFEATLDCSGPQASVQLGSHRLALGPSVVAARSELRRYAGATIGLGIRPEDLDDAAVVSGSSDDRRLRVRADLVEALGSDLLVHAVMDARPVRTDDVREATEDDVGGAVLGAGSTLIARCSPRSTIAPGDSVELVVDADRLHLFDLDTGLAIA